MDEFGPHTFERLRDVLPRRKDDPLDPERRAAAVLIPLFLVADALHVVLTKRAQALRRHSGEVSFPGGSRDPGDRTLEETALREAREEIGLHPGDVEVVGVLDDMPTAVSGYVIRPFVARVPHPYAYVPDHREVDRILRAPLDHFVDPERRREEIWERDGRSFPMTFFDVEGEVVWGATARLMVILLDRIAGREPERVRIPMPPPDIDP